MSPHDRVADSSLLRAAVTRTLRLYAAALTALGVLSLLVCWLFLVLPFGLALLVALLGWTLAGAGLVWWRRRHRAVLASASAVTVMWASTMLSFGALGLAVGAVLMTHTSWWWITLGSVLLASCLVAAAAVLQVAKGRRPSGAEPTEGKGQR